MVDKDVMEYALLSEDEWNALREDQRDAWRKYYARRFG